MEAPRLERRLIAILAADVEGYSRHMERDEAATLATLSSHRLIVDDLIASHNGRITGTAGDSVLAEFQSVVDALDCAMKMQEAIAVANESQPTEHRLLFRIGINVGDVMVKDGDIFGDGVNIAARLETLADPGGICVSRGVRDHVRKMGQYAFRGSRRAERQEHRPADPRLSGAQRQPMSRTLEPSDEAPAAPASSPAEQHADDPAEFELAFWEAMKDSKDPAEFESLPGAISIGRLHRPGRGPPPGAASGAGGARRTGGNGPRSQRRRARLLGYGQGQRQPGNARGLSRALS